MTSHEYIVATPIEAKRVELDKLFDFDRRSAVQRALSKREGARWQALSMQQKTDELYAALGNIRAEAEKMFGAQALVGANSAERNTMLDALILSELGTSITSQEPISSGEQAPVPKEEWLKRYAGMVSPHEADAAYGQYVRKVREGKIKP